MATTKYPTGGTALFGSVADEAEVLTVLARIHGLGLDVIEMRRLPDSSADALEAIRPALRAQQHASQRRPSTCPTSPRTGCRDEVGMARPAARGEQGASVLVVTVTFRKITAANLESVLALRTTPEQERFVSSIASSVAEAAECPEAKPWHRAVYANERPVGFVMLSWNVEPQPAGIKGPWFLWKLLIDYRHQRQGYGQEVVRQVVDLVRANGGNELLTSYVPGDHGPAGFYSLLGFTRTGDVDPDGEIMMRLDLTADRWLLGHRESIR